MCKRWRFVAPKDAWLKFIANQVCHYIFASTTPHTTAMMPVMLAVGMSVPGMPIKVFALLLAMTHGIMGVITPYATGPAPIYYGAGYISGKDFWRLGFIFGVIFIVALLGISAPIMLATDSGIIRSLP